MAAAETQMTVHVRPVFETLTDAELANRFTYHRPHGDQPDRFHAIREQALSLARSIVALTPPSLEQNASLLRLDEVVMFANAAIARNEPNDDTA